jgi:hypothetical protein
MTQTKLSSLVKKINDVLPNWEATLANKVILVKGLGDLDFISMTIKIAPAVPEEVFAEIDTGIDYSRLGPNAKETIDGDTWFRLRKSSGDYLGYLIPRMSTEDFIKKIRRILSGTIINITNLEKALVQCDLETSLILK